MSGEMLSYVLLELQDDDLVEIYYREKMYFYQIALPSIWFMFVVYLTGMSVGYRVLNYGTFQNDILISMPDGTTMKLYENEYLFEIINGGFFVFFFIVWLTRRWCSWLHTLVCPALTIHLYYNTIFVDYEKSILSIQNT